MTEAPAAPAKPSVWRAFAQPAAWTMLFFGFSSGLPFLLVAGTLAYWLKENQIEIKSITMIASAGMTYAFKFLWAPLLDHWQLPLLHRLGRRRSWFLLAQLGVVAGLLAMAALTPARLTPFVAATVMVAFFGATQDIAVDAYLIEIAPLAARGALVATYSLGYRIGLLAAGALALIAADHVPWRLVYIGMAVLMAIPIAANLLAREPDVVPRMPARWGEAMRNAIVEPIVDFFRRYPWQLAAATLLFILILKIPEQATIGGIMSPFYRDMGFSLTAIGTISKVYGVVVGIAGVFIGGAAVARFGVWPVLLTAIVVCGSCNLLYILLITHPGDLWMLTAVISAENFTLGFLNPPTVAFLSSLVNRQHTATQYALLVSLVNVLGKFLGFFAGSIVAAAGYAYFFVLTVLAVLPAALLCVWLWSRFRKLQSA